MGPWAIVHVICSQVWPFQHTHTHTHTHTRCLSSAVEMGSLVSSGWWHLRAEVKQWNHSIWIKLWRLTSSVGQRWVAGSWVSSTEMHGQPTEVLLDWLKKRKPGRLSKDLTWVLMIRRHDLRSPGIHSWNHCRKDPTVAYFFAVISPVTRVCTMYIFQFLVSYEFNTDIF